MTIIAAPRINFPVFTTPLIGRDADVSTITTRLRRSPHRFATLVGTSGTGKTRLSMQIASAMEGDFPDGMAFVPLASITDPALVVPTIARILGLPESNSTSFFNSLSSHIGEQTMLLVLDNFEQVVDAAPTVVQLLSHIPNAHVLCTSQVPMHLADEEIIPIPPLTLPDKTDSLEALEASPAVALFVDRMRHVQPHFALNKRNASAVSELCRRLHGLPLAIELVATHSERLQPDDLLLLLRAYLPQERNRRDALSPDEVIFPVLSWCVSYGPPSIRWLLPRLGVLWGEWREEQAQALVHDAPTYVDVSETLAMMVSKGLLLSIESATAEPTFTMLDAIRQFAVRRLRTDPKLTQAVSMRHAEVFAGQLQSIDTGFRAGESTRFGPIFSGAMPNIRAALQWFLAQHMYTEAVGMIGNLAFASYQQGYLRESLDWVDRTTPFIDQTPPESQMRWYYAQGLLALNVSDFPRAIQSADLGVLLARQLGNSEYATRMLNNKGLIFLNQGLFAEAHEIFSVTVNEPSLTPLARATILNNLGMITKQLDTPDASLAYHQQSLAIREEFEDTFGIAMSLHNIADVYDFLQDYAKAEELYRQCLAIMHHAPQSMLVVTTMMALGSVLLNRDPLARPPEAQELIRSATKMFGQQDAQRELAACFDIYADWLIRSKQYVLAAELLGAATQIHERLDVICNPQQSAYITTLREQIDAAIGAAPRIQAEAVGATRSIADCIAVVGTH